MFARKAWPAFALIGALALASVAAASPSMPMGPAGADPPTSESGDFYTHYQSFRDNVPEVDLVIAQVYVDGDTEPDPDKLHKVLRRISHRLTMDEIRDLPAGSWPSISSHDEKKLRKDLSKLAGHLEEGIGNLSFVDQYIFLQILDAQVLGRLAELYDGHPDYDFCDPTAGSCDGPRILNELDAVGNLITNSVIDLTTNFPLVLPTYFPPGSSPSYPAVELPLSLEGYGAFEASTRVEQVVSQWSLIWEPFPGAIPGVPSIDRVIGVPSID